MRGPFKEEFYQCVTFGAYTARWQEQLYSTISLLLMYVIPLVTMVTAYLLIFRTIARKSRDFLQEGEWALGAGSGTGGIVTHKVGVKCGLFIGPENLVFLGKRFFVF